MAFADMCAELTGCVPKLPVNYAKTLINRAWKDVSRANLWSWQLFEGNWTSPALINAGTVTTTQGLTTITFNAAASSAIIAANGLGPFPTPLLQRQFRIGIGTIYNIWNVDVLTDPTAVVITLDRPYAEAGGSAQTYQIFQCYYPAPYKDFLTWINIRDIVNYNDLNIWGTRKQIDLKDPQRTIYYIPTDCVYYQQDQNPNNDTYGTPLFELWGVPQYVLTYQLYGIRKGTPMTADDDQLPFAIGEDCVTALGRKYAYEWAEANKGDVPRAAGSDFRFLMGVADADYKRLVREYRRQDRETADQWFEIRSHRGMFAGVQNGFYNAINNSANPGAPW